MTPNAISRNTRWKRATLARLFLAATIVASLVAPICASSSSRQPVMRATAEDEIAASARAALARMPPEERLAGIKDERLRRAVQSAYHAVAELAGNREPGKVASLNARFERAYAVALREAVRADYKTCASNCNADGETCRQSCAAKGKKLCGCKLVVFGCLVAECIF